MSSKVVTGEAASAAPGIVWLRVPSAPTPVWLSGSAAAIPAPAGPSLTQAEAGAENRAAERERRVREARQEGFREGEASGLQRASAQLEPVLDKLARTAEELAACRGRYRREAEQDLVRLALAVARRILRRELTIDPAVMLGLVKAALDQLDLRETHRLRMHPQDAPALEQRLKDLGLPSRLEVVPDAGLERGGAVFETLRGEVDASVDTQLSEISRGLADLVERRQ